MKLYGLDLPKLIPENAAKIIRLAQRIHRQKNQTRVPRKTERWKWDNYWVEAYDVVLKELSKIHPREEKNGRVSH